MYIKMENGTNVLVNRSRFPGLPPPINPIKRIILSSTFCTLMITGLAMNLLIISAICKKRLLKRSINYFIFNMVIADILLCCSDVAMHFALFITYANWVVEGMAGIILCKIMNFASEIAPIVSTLSLVFMSLDRFLAIVYPTKANLRTSKTRRILLVLSWLIPAIYSLKNLYAYTVLASFPGQSLCGEWWGENHRITSTILINLYIIAFIFIPLVLLAIMYGAIAVILQRRQAFSKNIIPTEQQRLRQMQRKRINILAFSIVLGFALCHGPQYFYVYVYRAFINKWDYGKSKAFRNMVQVSIALAYSNATINPIICIVFNHEIKRAVKEFFPFFVRRPFGGGSLELGSRSVEMDTRTTITTHSSRSKVNEGVEIDG